MKRHLILLLIAVFFYSCSTSQQATAPESDPTTKEKVKPEEQTEKPKEPIDFSTLEEPPKDWHHLDKQQSQFQGISSQLAYGSILKGKSAKKEIVVAVIDGGVDAEHEDLKNVMWVNEDEVPNNGQDDDQNGYVDDVHGWNFIGGPNGQNVDNDTFELARIYGELHEKFNDVDPTTLNAEMQEQYHYYEKIRSAYASEIRKYYQQYNNIKSFMESLKRARSILDDHFSDSAYTFKDIQALQPMTQQMNFAKYIMTVVEENDIDTTSLGEQKKQVYEFAKYGYNPDFETRQIVGDNYEDKSERIYGNNDVEGPDASHGTHVAGIIAAQRDNQLGMNGVATNTRIMAVRAVPDGDERDKDVANAIRYAVDNGAHIINMSFGKSYSPHKEVVDEAVKYADEHGVLMVHAAGNSSENSDQKESYPTDTYATMPSDSAPTLWISVGASSWRPGDELLASFSNYGDETVDVFAPGDDIYSTMPDNEYKFQGGTSMAAPVVSGMAALIMAYYPDLTPQQVRQLILENVTQFPDLEVLIPNQNNPNATEKEPFAQFSAYDGVVNLQKALQAAEKMTQ